MVMRFQPPRELGEPHNCTLDCRNGQGKICAFKTFVILGVTQLRRATKIVVHRARQVPPLQVGLRRQLDVHDGMDALFCHE